MTLDEGNVSILDQFTHKEQDRDKIQKFNFWQKQEKKEKVKIDETSCTLVTVSGKYLEKKTFKEVLKKIDEIRHEGNNQSMI